LRAKKGHNIAVVALARKLIVLIWHVLKKQTPYRYADPTRTRTKLRMLDPTKREMPEWESKYKTIEQIYEEFRLPPLPEASNGEKRIAKINKRIVTRTRNKRAQEKDAEKMKTESTT